MIHHVSKIYQNEIICAVNLEICNFSNHVKQGSLMRWLGRKSKHEFFPWGKVCWVSFPFHWTGASFMCMLNMEVNSFININDNACPYSWTHLPSLFSHVFTNKFALCKTQQRWVHNGSAALVQLHYQWNLSEDLVFSLFWKHLSKIKHTCIENRESEDTWIWQKAYIIICCLNAAFPTPAK